MSPREQNAGKRRHFLDILSKHYLQHNSTDYEYLIHSQLPLGYCHPPMTKMNIKIIVSCLDQCAFNRSEILCGKCLPGFSQLSLGNCMKCSIYWSLVCLAIIICAVLAGILLVALLLALHLTVAVGTINGVIYANIIHANISTFFPFTDTNYYLYSTAKFRSWNQYLGMDIYLKTLLQLAFPACICYIFLVVMAIITSECCINLLTLSAERTQ